MGRTKKPSICITLQQAKLIELARAVETSGDKSLNWTESDAEAASLRAAHALGEGAAAERMLTERARLVLAAAAERGASTSVGTRARLPLMLAPVLVIGAYVLGALCDRIASPEHLVNLLSPPFWTVIAWNLLIYCVLFLCALGILGSRRDRFGLPLRSFLTAFVEKAAFSTLSFKKGFKSSFYARWSALAAPLVRLHVARVLHLSAVAFALGLITSLLVRGFGTAYWAGWESTWLADNPEAVKTFLDCTYGLIPSIGGLPEMPDLAAVAALRADNLPYLKSAPSAGPWLVRMMLFMVLVVVLPRLLLAAVDSWRISRFHRRVTISLDDPYFSGILAQCAEDAALGRLFIITSSVERPLRVQSLERVRRDWGLESDSLAAVMDYDDPESPVPAVEPDARRTVLLVWLDAAQTPEEDTHALALAKVRAAAESTPGAVAAALVDLCEFSEHFKGLPARIKERTELWTQFAARHGFKSFVLTPSPAERLAMVKALRAWAASQAVHLESVESKTATLAAARDSLAPAPRPLPAALPRESAPAQTAASGAEDCTPDAAAAAEPAAAAPASAEDSAPRASRKRRAALTSALRSVLPRSAAPAPAEGTQQPGPTAGNTIEEQTEHTVMEPAGEKAAPDKSAAAAPSAQDAPLAASKDSK